jgi:hypothetical protein
MDIMLALTPSQQKLALIETDLMVAMRTYEKASKRGNKPLCLKISSFMRTKIESAKAFGVKITDLDVFGDRPLNQNVELARVEVLTKRLAKERRLRSGFIDRFTFTATESVFSGVEVA